MNDVGVHGGGEAVGNHQPGTALGEGAKAAQPILFCPGIHGAGRLVQDDQRGPPEKSARQRDPLPFAPAQFLASKPLAQQRLETSRQPFDRLQRSRIPGGLPHASLVGGSSISPKAIFSPAVAW